MNETEDNIYQPEAYHSGNFQIEIIFTVDNDVCVYFSWIEVYLQSHNITTNTRYWA